MQYKILSSAHIDILEREVYTFLADGWQLIGGVSAAYKHEHSPNIISHLIYVQAIAKTSNEKLIEN